MSVGIEVRQIRLIVEAKFGDDPWTFHSDREIILVKKFV